MRRAAVAQEEAQDPPPPAAEIEEPRSLIQRSAELPGIAMDELEVLRRLAQWLRTRVSDRVGLQHRIRESRKGDSVDHRFVDAADENLEPLGICQPAETLARFSR